MESESVIEHEVPPRRSDRAAINAILLRHPVAHFIVLFCWCFTVTALVRTASIHLFHSGETWSEIDLYGLSLLLSIVFYFGSRRRWKALKSAEK